MTNERKTKTFILPQFGKQIKCQQEKLPNIDLATIDGSFYQIILHHKNFVKLRPWKGYHKIRIFFRIGEPYFIFSHTKRRLQKVELFDYSKVPIPRMGAKMGIF